MVRRRWFAGFEGTTADAKAQLEDLLAVFLGDRLSHRVQMNWVRVFAASLFVIFGILLINLKQEYDNNFYTPSYTRCGYEDSG